MHPSEFARLGAVACVLTGAALTLGWRLEDGLALPRSPLVTTGLLFTALAAASVAWSAIPFSAFIAFCTFLLLPAGAAIFALSPDRRLSFGVAGWGAGLVLAGLGLWALVEYSFFPQMLVAGRVRWPFANPNGYAALLALGFFPGIGFFLVERRWRRAAGFALAALTLTGIVLTGSRAVMVLTLPGTMLLLYLCRAQLMQRWKCVAMLALLAAAVFFVPLLRPDPAAAPNVLGRFAAVHSDASLSARAAIWRGTAKLVAAHPLRGTGIGTFVFYYPQVRLPADTASGGFMAHADPLQFWAEMGVAAPLLFYTFFALLAWRGRCWLRTCTPAAARRVMPIALAAGIGLLFLHCHFDFDFYEAPILALAGPLLAAFGMLTAPDAPPAAAPARLPAGAGWCAALLPAIALIFVLQGFLRSEARLSGAPTLLAIGDVERFAWAVNSADRLGFGANPRAALIAASVPIGIVAGGDPVPAAERAAFSTKARGLLDRAARGNPRLPEIDMARAQLALADHDTGGATRDLDEALALDPQYLPARLQLAKLAQARGDSGGALALLEDGLQWPAINRGLPGEAQDYFDLMTRLAALRHDEAAAARIHATIAGINARRALQPGATSLRE